MTYWERLTHLKLMSLQRRHERNIIITMWKILNGEHPNNMDIQFQHPKRKAITARLPLTPPRRAQGQKSPRGSTRIVVFQLRGYPWPVNPNQGEFANADPSAL